MAQPKQGTPHPSRPASDSEPGVHDERPSGPRPDRLPPGTHQAGAPARATGAGLRLAVEALLDKREAIPLERWLELLPAAIEMLRTLLDDGSISAAQRQRVMIALGQVARGDAVDRLGEILRDGDEAPIDRAYAATGLGFVGTGRAVAALARATGDSDPMVRRQIVAALARTATPEAIPLLTRLSEDDQSSVADYARQALSRRGAKSAPRASAERKRTIRPHDDDGPRTSRP